MDLIQSLGNLPSGRQLAMASRAAMYEAASLAANTNRTYSSMWGKFERWCQEHGCMSFPASSETIGVFLGDLGGHVSFSTLDSTIAAIEKVHQQRGTSVSGNVQLYRNVRRGIRRLHKEQQSVRQAKALSVADLMGASEGLGDSLKATRDKALIALCFFGALRRSEAVALDVANIEVSEKGMIVRIMQSKTSDTAVNIYVGHCKDRGICPVELYKAWLAASGITDGPVFRPIAKGGKVGTQRLSGHAVAVLMKSTFGEAYSGHSARRGLATCAAESGVSIARIQQHTRHKSADMVLRYVERATGFEHSSTKSLGL
jgi:integrase